MKNTDLARNPPRAKHRLVASASLSLQSGLLLHSSSSSAQGGNADLTSGYSSGGNSKFGGNGTQTMSSAQFQRQLLGGTSLSLALPRARQPKPCKPGPPPAQQQQALNRALGSNRGSNALSVSVSGRGWTCAVCGSSNHWHYRSGNSNRSSHQLGVNSSSSRAGDNDTVCEVCSQRALASSLEDLVAQHENTSSSTTSRRRRSSDDGSALSAATPSTNDDASRMENDGHPALSNAQWAALEDAAAERQLTSEAEPCPICLEDFTLHDLGGQVITSCSHLFHATCLRSFEAFQSASHNNHSNSNSSSSSARASSHGASSSHGIGNDLDQWVAALAAADYSAAISSSHSSSSSSHAGMQQHQHQQQPPRACPTCRAPFYQRRATAVGGLGHRRTCATKMQALMRGVLQRKRYAVVVRKWIGGGGGDEARRRKYVSQELEALSSKLLAGAVGGDSIDALFAQSDAALQFSQGVFQRASPPHPGDSSSSSSSSFSNDQPTNGRSSGGARNNDSAHDPSRVRSSTYGNEGRAAKKKPRSLGTTERQWAWALASAESRGDRECAICMSSLDVPAGAAESRSESITTSCRRSMQAKESKHTSSSSTLFSSSSSAKGRCAVLLSCSHVFHSACVSAFERFTLHKPPNMMSARSQHHSANSHQLHRYDRNNAGSSNFTRDEEIAAASTRTDDEFVCPMCRASYDRRPLIAAPSSGTAGNDLYAFADLDDVAGGNMNYDDDDDEEGNAAMEDVVMSNTNEEASGGNDDDGDDTEEGAGVRRSGHAT